MERSKVLKSLLLLIATLYFECGGSIAALPQESNRERLQFTPPKIPTTIAGVENRREYLTLHYWDNFDFSDTKLLQSDSLMRIAVGGYIQLLMMSTPSVVEQSVDAALSRAIHWGYDPFERLSSRFEDWLYNPNSPMRNEELYIFVLRYTIDKAPLKDIYKIRPRKQLNMVMKNRTGEMAINFDFETLSGDRSTLYDIKSKYTILFFNTPDCDDCARVKEHIGSSTLLSGLVQSGELKILGIYTEQDLTLWRKASYPTIITNGADTKGEITTSRLYDLKALPTLYLLSSDKIVILKDRSIEEIERYLSAGSR